MVILCDFDDTAADRNVATLLLDGLQSTPFSSTTENWRSLHKQFLDSEITLAEYQENAFERLASTRSEQAAYAQKHADLRPGFRELAEYCQEQRIEIAVVSHGLDFYIQALLDKAGLGYIPQFAVQTGEAAGRTTFTYNFAKDGCPWAPGNCKCYIVEEYRERGHAILYAGDGLSDTCPARKADFVFARDGLLSFCQAYDLPHRELTDFHVVLDFLKEQGPEGLR